MADEQEIPTDAQEPNRENQGSIGGPENEPKATWPRTAQDMSQALLGGIERRSSPLPPSAPTVRLDALGDTPPLTFSIVDLPPSPAPTVRLDTPKDQSVKFIGKPAPTVRLDTATTTPAISDVSIANFPAPTVRLDQITPTLESAEDLAEPVDDVDLVDPLADPFTIEHTFHIKEQAAPDEDSAVDVEDSAVDIADADVAVPPMSSPPPSSHVVEPLSAPEGAPSAKTHAY